MFQLPAYLDYQYKAVRLKSGIILKCHVLTFDQTKDSATTTLLISKCSEAVSPNTQSNHIGEGASMDSFLEAQQGVRLLINGGFSHYRKDFYQWSHQQFNVGDPVGMVKIRNHFFEDYKNLDNYGFFVQDNKEAAWQIVKADKLTKSEKYILGCTPLLIYENTLQELPITEMQPLPAGVINPPSVLGHGNQKHPRTAIGVKDTHIIFVLVDQDDTQEGCTLEELQDLGHSLGLSYFLNLDGGGSSQFRLVDQKGVVHSNHVCPEDRDRILGHVLVIFDENLKKS